MKYKYLLHLVIITLLTLIGIRSEYTFAQPIEKINPLEIRERDELLPSIDRPLSDFEKNKLREQFTILNEQVNAELKAENIDNAFAIWYRIIRLKRYFGVEEEIKSLTNIGAMAWEKSRNEDINYIYQRLIILETENTEKNGEIKSELIPIFATAYEAIHNLDKSILFYQKILKIAREKSEQQNIKLALQKLGTFYLAKFDYYQAEPIYKELLAIAREEEDYLNEGIYLRQLAEIDGQIMKSENGVTYKEQLVEIYLKNQQLQLIADLKISIADDYKKLNKLEEASKYYQEAFNIAWSLQQFASAGDALRKLGRLYEENNQDDYALQIYQELIKLEQQSYNLYGLMNTYDSIGQIYARQNNNNLALRWFQKSLEIAYHLKYKVDYFNSKIQQLNQPQQ